MTPSAQRLGMASAGCFAVVFICAILNDGWGLEYALGKPMCAVGPTKQAMCYAVIEPFGPFVQLPESPRNFTLLGVPMFRFTRHDMSPEFLHAILNSLLQPQQPVVVRFQFQQRDPDSKAPTLERLAAEVPQLPIFKIDCGQFVAACQAANVVTNAFVLYAGHGQRPFVLADNFDLAQQYQNALRSAFGKLFPEVMPDADATESAFAGELAGVSVRLHWGSKKPLPLDWFLLAATLRNSVAFSAATIEGKGPPLLEVRVAGGGGEVIHQQHALQDASFLVPTARDSLEGLSNDTIDVVASVASAADVAGRSVLLAILCTLMFGMLPVACAWRGFRNGDSGSKVSTDIRAADLAFEMCPVCLGPQINAVSLGCGHSCCRVCFKSMWLPQSGNWVGPTCASGCGTALPLKVPPVNFALQAMQERALGSVKWKQLVEGRAHEEEELDAELRCPGGFERGSVVYSLVNKTLRGISVNKGDKGVVLGPNYGVVPLTSRLLVCNFSDSRVIALPINDLCCPLPGGYSPGQEVISLITFSWDNGRSLSAGDVGTVTGPGQDDTTLTCAFPRNHSTYIKITDITPVAQSLHPALPCGLRMQGEVVCLINQDWDDGKQVRIGDIGTVLGPGTDETRVRCKFENQPCANICVNQVEARSDFEAPMGGYSIGEEVESLIDGGQETGNRVRKGDVGTVLGGCGPQDRHTRIVCQFPNWLAVRILMTQISKTTFAGRGQEVVCVINHDWEDGKQVRIGDIGTVLGPDTDETRVRCKFENNPDADIYVNQVEARGMGGYSVGEDVKSLE